jgi:hypothetical protein
MRNFILFVSLALLTIACHNQKTSTDNNQSMKKYTVTGKIEQTAKYCGGAKPTQEVLEGYKQPKPLTEFKLYVKINDLNHQKSAPIDSTITDENGIYSFNLPKGNYIIVSELQLNQTNFESKLAKMQLKITDQDALNNYFKKGMTTFTISQDTIINLDVLIQKKCDIPEGVLGLESIAPPRP